MRDLLLTTVLEKTRAYFRMRIYLHSVARLGRSINLRKQSVSIQAVFS